MTGAFSIHRSQRSVIPTSLGWPASGQYLSPRSEHRISRNDQTGELSGTDGGQLTRSPTSLRFAIPRSRTRPMVGECEPPWRWNQSPIATPERPITGDAQSRVRVSLGNQSCADVDSDHRMTPASLGGQESSGYPSK